MDDELDYISSSPLVGVKREIKPEDEAQLPALERVAELLNAQVASYDSVELTLARAKVNKLSVENQMVANSQTVKDLLSVKTLVETTISDIREVHNG